MNDCMLLRVATRSSPLARAQTALVVDLIRARVPQLEVTLVPVTTAADRDTGRLIRDLGERGVFTKAVQDALLDGRADVAVHSLKDLPTAPAPGLTVVAVPARADPRDALVAGARSSLAELPTGARVGSSSPRRAAQVRLARPDVKMVPLRGSVGTRVAAVVEGRIDATLLAVAGLQRAGLTDAVSALLEPPNFLPAPGQGALAIEVREDRADLITLLADLDDPAAQATTSAERAFLQALQGGCSLPAGALATIGGERLTLQAAVFGPEGAPPVTVEGDTAAALDLGRRAADAVLDAMPEGLA